MLKDFKLRLNILEESLKKQEQTIQQMKNLQETFKKQQQTMDEQEN